MKISNVSFRSENLDSDEMYCIRVVGGGKYCKKIESNRIFFWNILCNYTILSGNIFYRNGISEYFVVQNFAVSWIIKVFSLKK